ncbi:MAG: hypothetical protein OXH15_05390 [Gammaproteobacteria bacterium]|nr:hypothetical protein [Gammaproteobacteria bacterium]
MNDSHDNQRESIDEQIARLEIEKLRLETQLIEGSLRRDRVPPGARHREVDRHRCGGRPRHHRRRHHLTTLPGASAPVGAPRPPRRSQKPLPARSGSSRASGTVGAAHPLRAATTPPRSQAGWCLPLSVQLPGTWIAILRSIVSRHQPCPRSERRIRVNGRQNAP